MGSECGVCRKGQLVWQAETVARIPIHYRRCTHCGAVVKPHGYAADD